jgi:cytochrome c biogenesis protein CcdA
LVLLRIFFAQSLQAFQERMRTPWMGSILIAFLLWNWHFARDTALLARFSYFEMHTDWRSLFAGRIISGFVFAAAKP